MEQSQPGPTTRIPLANGEAMAIRTRIRGWGGHCSPASPFNSLKSRGKEIDLAVHEDGSS
jgi:hypothetical protein